MTGTPMAFQVVAVPPETIPVTDTTPRVRVLLLCYVAMAGPAISPRTALAVIPATLRWTHGDWKLVAGDRAYAHLVASPGAGLAGLHRVNTPHDPRSEPTRPPRHTEGGRHARPTVR